MADAMAHRANLVRGGRHHRVRTPQERERAFRSASRHSLQVRFLRFVLPVVAVLVLSAYFVSTRMNVTVGDMTASIDGMEIADGALRMLNPTLKGTDEKSGDYVVTAEYADQDIENPNLIKLHAIKADISDPDGGWSKLKAVRGKFDNKTERLIMKDHITIATSSGVTGELSYATVDMASQTVRSHHPVSFDLPNGTVKANAMTLRSGEKIIMFRGNVRVHLEPQEEPQKNAGAARAPGAQAAPQQQVPPQQQAVPQQPPAATGAAETAAPQ